MDTNTLDKRQADSMSAYDETKSRRPQQERLREIPDKAHKRLKNKGSSDKKLDKGVSKYDLAASTITAWLTLEDIEEGASA